MKKRSAPLSTSDGDGNTAQPVASSTDATQAKKAKHDKEEKDGCKAKRDDDTDMTPAGTKVSKSRLPPPREGGSYIMAMLPECNKKSPRLFYQFATFQEAKDCLSKLIQAQQPNAILDDFFVPCDRYRDFIDWDYYTDRGLLIEHKPNKFLFADLEMEKQYIRFSTDIKRVEELDAFYHTIQHTPGMLEDYRESEADSKYPDLTDESRKALVAEFVERQAQAGTKMVSLSKKMIARSNLLVCHSELIGSPQRREWNDTNLIIHWIPNFEHIPGISWDIMRYRFPKQETHAILDVLASRDKMSKTLDPSFNKRESRSNSESKHDMDCFVIGYDPETRPNLDVWLERLSGLQS
jgi:hypothetical protein